jgi:soluble lytic murein transglycosylase-like protein
VWDPSDLEKTMSGSCGPALRRIGTDATQVQVTLLLLATVVVGAGCASRQLPSVSTAPPELAGPVTRIGGAQVSNSSVRREWSALSRAGRQALLPRRYEQAEKYFAAALALTSELPSGDVRVDTSLGNLVRLAALYHRLDRPGDADRVMEMVAGHVESQGLEQIAGASYLDRYRDLIQQSIPSLFAPRREPRRRAPEAPSNRDFDGLIAQTSRRLGVDPALVKAVVAAESDFEAEAVSHAGAQGLMQLMPQTAREMGVETPFEPVENLNGGVRYLRAMLDRYGDTRLALAAYNAGPKAVDRHDGIPPYPETQAYVERVLDFYRGYRAQFSN